MIHILLFFYCGLLNFFTIGLKKLQTPPLKKTRINNFSIVVAARNEEENLPQLLDRLVKQNYPQEKFEIIVSDDRSTDGTSIIVEKFKKQHPIIKSVHIDKEDPHFVGKKNALNEAIKLSSFDVLVFTDADCLPGCNWLQEIDRYLTPETDFIAGFSPLQMKGKFFSSLKNLERSSIFAVSAGSIGWQWGLTCVARNMIYRKSIFKKVDGFSGIEHIRSGDDDLMLQKLAPYTRKMNFMFTEDSIVPTKDKSDFRSQVNLETRRASKWKYYPFHVKAMTLLVFLFYLSYILLFGRSLLKKKWTDFSIISLFKVTSEFCLLYSFLKKCNKKHLLILFPIAELFYIPYFLFFALKGSFGKYTWKK